METPVQMPGDARGARTLCFETSAASASIAVAVGDVLLATHRLERQMRHAADLIPAADTLLRDQGWRPSALQQLFVSIGPGSFTGLRVAVTAARHLALATNLKIVAVPTLQVVAEQAAVAHPTSSETTIAVILEAKRGIVFAAEFTCRDAICTPSGTTRMIDPHALLAELPRPLILTGAAIATYPELAADPAITVADASLLLPQAEFVHRIGCRMAAAGQFSDPITLVPHYVRRPEAEELWEQRHN